MYAHRRLPNAVLLLALVLLPVLAACGPGVSSPAPAPAPAAPAAAAPTAVPAAAAPTAAAAPAPVAAASPAAAANAQTEPRRGGQFVTSSFADAKTIQPLLSSDSASSTYIGLHYDAALLELDPKTLDYVPYAAKSYELSPDGMTITYKLRDDIFWSDGTPITAADYKFTWEKRFDPKVDFPYRSLYRNFEPTLDTPDDRTVIFKLKEPFCPALAYSSVNPIPKHVFENLDINDNPFNQKPTVGSGPFLLQEWRRDEYAIFTANERFHQGRPYLDRYIVRIVKDQFVEFEMFKKGEIDAASIRPEDWEDAQKLPNAQLFSYYAAGAPWSYIGMNLRSPFLQDKRVRQAISHALDTQGIIDAVRLGHGKPMYGPYPFTSWVYTDDLPRFDYDPKKAAALLDEAGWTLPPGGRVRVKDGREFAIRIFYNAGNKDREKIATLAQEFLGQAGIKVEVIPEEWNSFLERVNKTYDFELNVLGWTGTIEPHAMQSVWTSNGGQNSTGFKNERVDELFTQGASAPGCSQADRRPYYVEIQKIIAEEQPYVFLYAAETLVGYSNRLVLNEPTRVGVTYDIHKIWSKTGQ